MDTREQLEQIRAEAEAAMENAASLQELDAVRVKYLGKKGELTAVLKTMGKLSPEERPIVGQMANEVRELIAADLEKRNDLL
ncbi:MAG: phenylalanine--tRNA ligase subunit alpha, partial [Clostridia bacterium]|nr:phenylalanine--tRNA ligase subunit alpha [Clostridia bacterium]